MILLVSLFTFALIGLGNSVLHVLDQKILSLCVCVIGNSELQASGIESSILIQKGCHLKEGFNIQIKEGQTWWSGAPRCWRCTCANNELRCGPPAPVVCGPGQIIDKRTCKWPCVDQPIGI